MSNLKQKAQLLSKLYYSFARWKIWGRFMKNYRFPPLSEQGKNVKPINPLQKSWRSSFHNSYVVGMERDSNRNSLFEFALAHATR